MVASQVAWLGRSHFAPNRIDTAACLPMYVHMHAVLPQRFSPPFICSREGRAIPSSSTIAPLPPSQNCLKLPKILNWTVGKNIYIPNSQDTISYWFETSFSYISFMEGKNKRGCRLFWPQEINLMLYSFSWDLLLFSFCKSLSVSAFCGAIRTFSP